MQSILKGVAWLALAALSHAQALASPRYRMTVVDAPAGFVNAYGRAVNDAGDLVGWLTRADGSQQYFFRWAADGVLRFLPVPGEGRVSSLNDINAARQMVGTSTAGAFRWSESEGFTIIAPPPGFVHAQPLSINRDGQVAGYVFEEDRGRPDAVERQRLFFWNARDGMRILHPDRRATAAAINDRAQIAATALTVVRRWREEAIVVGADGGTVRLWPSTKEGVASRAAAINDAGYVAGWRSDVGVYGSGAVWLPAGGTWTLPAAAPIGISSTNTVLFSFGSVWTQRYGMRNIEKWLVDGSRRMNRISTRDISPAGLIAGSGKDDGRYHALIFTPEK